MLYQLASFTLLNRPDLQFLINKKMKEYMIVNNQRVKKLEKEHLSEEKSKEGNKQDKVIK